MEGLDQEVEQELTPEQEAADDAAFEAAFNSARGLEPRTEGTTLQNDASGQPLVKEVIPEQDDSAEQAAAAAQAETDAAAAAEAEANAPVAITKAELDALRAVAGQVTQLQAELKRTNDTTSGRLGSLKQTLDAVKAQAQQGVKPTFKQMKRLEGEFPELAKLMSEDLEDAFGAPAAAAPAAAAEQHQAEDEGKASGDAPGAQADVDPLANPHVQKVLKEKEMAIVDEAHPDWRDLSKTPEFTAWKTSLPAAAQQLLVSSWDSKVLKDAFTDFKSWNSKRSAAADANKQRDKRLANAVPATTGAPTGANAIDEDAAFQQGFNSARGNR